MLSFKIGQKIKIKPLNWFECSKDVRTGWIKRFGVCFTKSMAERYCGNEYTIVNILDDKFYVLDKSYKSELIFEYAVDILESAKLNQIELPIIEKGNFPGYDKTDTRTDTEVKELIIYKINHEFATIDATELIGRISMDSSGISVNEIKKRPGRPKGSKSKTKNIKTITPGKSKLNKGDLVIYWNRPSKVEFGLAQYLETVNKEIKVIIDGQIKTVLGITPYNKDTFDQLTSNAISHIQNIDKDLDKLNSEIRTKIKDFEVKYGVTLSTYTDIILIR